jgi:hypothetical protein
LLSINVWVYLALWGKYMTELTICEVSMVVWEL